MSKPNDGGPAFPQSGTVSPSGGMYVSVDHGGGGMSLRAWLAGMAMQGLLANPFYAEQNAGMERGCPDELARACICNTDALIAELEKEAK